jgi:hypothetical protein
VIAAGADDTLREVACSFLIDPDPTLTEQKKALKEYMKTQKGLTPDSIPARKKKAV